MTKSARTGCAQVCFWRASWRCSTPLLFSLLLIWSASLRGTLDAILPGAVRQFARSWPLAMAAALASFGVAYFVHQSLISRATGARGIGRADARPGSTGIFAFFGDLAIRVRARTARRYSLIAT
jgi:hypothetical protein